MTKLVEAIAKSLVDNPDGVVVSETTGRQGTVIRLKVDPGDMGKVIGKQGRIAKAFRTVVNAAATKENKSDSRNCEGIAFNDGYRHIFTGTGIYVPIVIIRRKMEKIKIGKIVNAVALKGEVKIYNYSDYKERFEEIEKILVMDGRELIEMKIENIRYQKNMVIAKLGGVDDRTQAEKLKDCDVFITEEDLRILPEDTFYIRDLIGCAVVDDAAGQKIGTVKDVIQNCAQDIYQIELTSGGEALVPAVAQFIKKIDIENKIIKINVIPGLIGGAEEV